MKNLSNELFLQSLEELSKDETLALEKLEDELADYENDDKKYSTLLEIEKKCFLLGLKARTVN